MTHYVTGDLKPEERAKIEARIKAEDERQLMTDSFRSDLFGERTVLTDRGTDWLSACAYLGGRIL